MDLLLLRSFQKQVRTQCRFIILAAQEVDRGTTERDPLRTFYGIQNFLNAAANVSKALWGQAGKLSAERQPLRESLGVADDSSLRDPVMRNNFEHFDERLDVWWRDSAEHKNVDLSIGDKTMVLGVAVGDIFRWYDPATTDITFWGQRFNMRAIVDEVERITPTLMVEASKPHDEPTPDE